MSSFHVRGAARPLIGELTVPGDKSIGHRAVIFASLATGRSRVRGLSAGEDNRRTVAAFRALGVTISDEDRELLIDGKGIDNLSAPAGDLDCGNSGTTMRLLAGVLASRPFTSRLIGDRYLEARPMKRVAEPLTRMGARITGRTNDNPLDMFAPLEITGGALRGIEHRSPHASAQVKSAVLLAGLAAEGITRVVEPARSRDHTERMLRAQGAPLVIDAQGAITLDPSGWDRVLAPLDVVVPGDLSSAAFLLGAAAIVPGSVVTVRGVGVNPTRTGLIDALTAMGVALSVEPVGEAAGEPLADITVWGSPLQGAVIGGELAVRAIDELPLLAALAAHARGQTRITGARELRVKESDRIAGTVALLRALGVAVEELDDGMVIEGAPLEGKSAGVKGGVIDSHGDHRIAMAGVVAALFATGPSRIDDIANVATSFPGFLTTLQHMGAEVVSTRDG